MSILAFFVVGYLVGSIPTGFLAVRLTLRKDIRREGSGKTGGFNTFEVTQSKWIAVAVGVFDAFKGFVVAYVAWKMFPDDLVVQGAGIVGTLFGHIYPVWLGFKGGRGLATAAGALFALGQFLLVIWGIFWLVAYFVAKDIVKANIVGLVLSFIAVWTVPAEVLGWFMIRDVSPLDYCWLISAILIVLLLGHLDGVQHWIGNEAHKESHQ